MVNTYNLLNLSIYFRHMTDKFLLLVDSVKGETHVDTKKLRKLPVSELEALFSAVDRRIDIYMHIAEDTDGEDELLDCATIYKHMAKLQVILEDEIEERLNDIARFEPG